jgi:hypothetical protein
MTTPSGQISLDDIWQEPNPGWGSAESFGDIAYDSWEQGPLGSNINIYSGWGNDGSGGSVPVGANVIYNVGGALQRGVDPINFANYSNKTYYFDGTTFNIQYSWNNTLNNIPFPPPPVDNNVTVQVNCYDYSMVYTVHPGFNINANAATSGGPSQIPGFSPSFFPLVENVYWSIDVGASPTNTISNVAFSVNGVTRINTGPVGAGSTNFTWQSGGASQGYTNSSGITYDVVIT